MLIFPLNGLFSGAYPPLYRPLKGKSPTLGGFTEEFIRYWISFLPKVSSLLFETHWVLEYSLHQKAYIQNFSSLQSEKFCFKSKTKPTARRQPCRGFLIGTFRRGKNPSVLPREEKRAEQQKEGELYARLMQARLMLKPWLKLSHSIEKTPLPVHGVQCVWWDNKIWIPILRVEQAAGWTDGLDWSIAGKYPLGSV